MSIQNITFRCDHPGCVETVDALYPEGREGWMRLATPLVAEAVIISFDYCPDHAHLHVKGRA